MDSHASRVIDDVVDAGKAVEVDDLRGIASSLRRLEPLKLRGCGASGAEAVVAGTRHRRGSEQQHDGCERTEQSLPFHLSSFTPIVRTLGRARGAGFAETSQSTGGGPNG